MEFRILGPLEVVAHGGALALGGAQQRALLALLLVRAPEPVSRDRLVDQLWGERPPASAEHAVQVYVSGLRKVFRAGGGGAAVRSSASGYVLDVEPELFDIRRFERLVLEAQRVLSEDPAGAAELCKEALGLWRGPPLAEFEQFEFARREAERLEELRAVAIEGLVEARLECGGSGEMIGQITDVVAANPLRERPRGLLMLALYRSGRHAEALAAYRDACAALDELGLQPGPELRQLEEAILRHDPSLAAASAAAEAGAETLAADAAPRYVHEARPLTTPSELKEQLEGARRDAPFLIFRDGEGKQQIVTLAHTRDTLSVGRDNECDVCIGWDQRVSRLHARLERSGRAWSVYDASFSRNGTFLNGERVTGHRILKDGDELQFGATEMRFSDTSPKQPSTIASSRAVAGPPIPPAQRKVLVALCRPYKDHSPLAKPASNRQIATELYVNVDVVKGHLRSLFARFELEELPQNEKRVRLVQEAFVRGVVRHSDL